MGSTQRHSSFCLGQIHKAIPEALEYFYVDRIFDPAKKSAAAAVGDEVRRAVGSILSDESNNNWMDPETRKRVADKVGNVVFNVGYPDGFLKGRKDPYAGLRFSGDDYFVNVHRALRVRFDNRFRNSRYDFIGVKRNRFRKWKRN